MGSTDDIDAHPAIAPDNNLRRLRTMLRLLAVAVALIAVAAASGGWLLYERGVARDAAQARNDANQAQDDHQFEADHNELDRDHATLDHDHVAIQALCGLAVRLPALLPIESDDIKRLVEHAATAGDCHSSSESSAQHSSDAPHDDGTVTPSPVPVPSRTPGAGVTAAPPTPGHTSRPTSTPTVTRTATEPAAPRPEPSATHCTVNLLGLCI